MKYKLCYDAPKAHALEILSGEGILEMSYGGEGKAGKGFGGGNVFDYEEDEL